MHNYNLHEIVVISVNLEWESQKHNPCISCNDYQPRFVFYFLILVYESDPGKTAERIFMKYLV